MQSEETICRHIFWGFHRTTTMTFQVSALKQKKMSNKTNKAVGGNYIRLNVLNVLMFFCSRINFTGESRLCVLSLTQFF